MNPKIEVFQNMTGTTPAAWNDPTRGGELARSQFDRGADVVYAAAGATGLGVLQAAKDKGRLAIGVDSNQNYLHPGTILDLDDQARRPRRLRGLQDREGRDVEGRRAQPRRRRGRRRLLARSSTTASLITPEMEQRLEQARADIVAGKIKVTDYMAAADRPDA